MNLVLSRVHQLLVLCGVRIKSSLCVVIFTMLSFSSRSVHARSSAKIVNPTGYGSIIELVNAGINIGLLVLTIVAVIYIMISGFTYISAGGDEEKADKAKNGIKNTFIGLVVAFGGYLLVKFVLINFLNADAKYLEFFDFQNQANDIGF